MDEQEAAAALGLGSMKELQLALFWTRKNMTQGIAAERKNPASLPVRAGEGRRAQAHHSSTKIQPRNVKNPSDSEDSDA